MLGSWNHPDVAAAILKAIVSEANHWMVEKHGIFQRYHFFQHIGMERIRDGGEIALKPAPGGIDDHRFFARQIEAQQSRAGGAEPCEDRPHSYYDAGSTTAQCGRAYWRASGAGAARHRHPCPS
jgi:hypothetical protein